MKPASRRPALWLFVALASIAALAAALISQHVFDMQPCPWCVLQRVIFIAVALFALAALAWRTPFGQRACAVLVLGTSLCGAAAALWQHFVAAASSSCDRTLAERLLYESGLDGALPDVFEARASCADAAVQLFGVPYEFYSLALFTLFGLVALRVALRPGR